MHDVNLLEDQPVAWTPTQEVIERAQLTRFMKQVGVSTWDELYEFSIRDVEKFTEEVLKFLDIKFDPPYSRLLDTSDGIEFPSWFISPPRRGDAEDEQAETRPVGRVSGSNVEPGTRNAESKRESVPRASATGSTAGLNITTMCLDRWQTDEMRDQPAVIWEGEDGSEQACTYAELDREAAALAAGLQVGIFLPMTQDIATVLMAIGRIGAIAVPVFSGYGVEAIASRMDAVGAKALFACNGFERRGKFVDAFATTAAAVAKCSTIRKVIVRYLGGEEPELNDPKFEDWHSFMAHKSDMVGDKAWYQLGDAEPTSAGIPTSGG